LNGKVAPAHSARNLLRMREKRHPISALIEGSEMRSSGSASPMFEGTKKELPAMQNTPVAISRRGAGERFCAIAANQ
jgi:hypothetical protein